jgi:putative redox protein
MAGETKARLVWTGGLRLVGTSGSGHSLVVDGRSEHGGEETAPQPLETFLSGLGACTAMDVLSILRRMRRQVTSFEMELRAPRRDEHPRIWTELSITYRVQSPDATEAETLRAVQLSLDRYCSATAMVRATVPVRAQVILNDQVVGEITEGMAGSSAASSEAHTPS